MRTIKLLASVCLSALLTSYSFASESSYNYEVIAQNGVKIDGLSPNGFGPIAMNDLDTVVFEAEYPDGSYAGATGLFTGKHVLLKKGDIVGGLTVKGPSIYGINDLNQLLVTFSYGNGGLGSSALGTFLMKGSSLVLKGKLIKAGDVIDGLTLQDFRGGYINDAGEIVFAADYSDSSGAFAIGVFNRSHVLLKPGSVIQGIPLSGNYSFNNLYGLSDTGQFVFDTIGYLPNLGGTQTGAFTQHKVLAIAGDKVHGVPLLTAFSPVISRFGQTAFAGEYTIAPNCSSYLCMGFAVFGPRGVVAKTGDTIDGITLNNSLAPVSINDQGVVLMQANFAGGYGLFTKDDAVAVTGDKLAGFQVEGFVNSQINNFGDVGFSAFEGILLAKHKNSCKHRP
jgi:hypothetical protein